MEKWILNCLLSHHLWTEYKNSLISEVIREMQIWENRKLNTHDIGPNTKKVKLHKSLMKIWNTESILWASFAPQCWRYCLPANAGDLDLTPGPGGSHMSWSNYMNCSYWACALEPKSRKYWGLHTLESMLHNRRSHHSEKPAHPTKEQPCSLQLEKSPQSQK